MVSSNFLSMVVIVPTAAERTLVCTELLLADTDHSSSESANRELKIPEEVRGTTSKFVSQILLTIRLFIASAYKGRPRASCLK